MQRSSFVERTTLVLTNMEYTAAFEMGRQLAVGGWTVTSIITDHNGKIHHELAVI
jgi:hypothetical protein